MLLSVTSGFATCIIDIGGFVAEHKVCGAREEYKAEAVRGGDDLAVRRRWKR